MATIKEGTITQAQFRVSVIPLSSDIDTTFLGTSPYLTSALLTIVDDGGRKITGYLSPNTIRYYYKLDAGETWESPDNINWTLINPTPGTLLSSSGDRVAFVHCPGYGLYYWNGVVWAGPITATLPTVLLSSGSTFYGIFPGFGLYQWTPVQAPFWQALNTIAPTAVVLHNGIIYASFTAYGDYYWISGTQWAYYGPLGNLPSQDAAYTGQRVVTSPGGSTYSWTSVDQNFNFYSSIGYTYTLDLPSWVPVSATPDVWTTHDQYYSSATLGDLKLGLSGGTAFINFTNPGVADTLLGRAITIWDSQGIPLTGYLKDTVSEYFKYQTPNIYHSFDNTNWTVINSVSGVVYLSSCGSTCYAVYPQGTGIWVWRGGTTWEQITPNTPTQAAQIGSILFGNFGLGPGLWWWNTIQWAQATPNSPNSMRIIGGYLVGDFGVGGYWKFLGPAQANWIQVYSYPPSDLVLSQQRIVSAPNNTTFYWGSMGSGFNMYDKNGYTYVIWSDIADPSWYTLSLSQLDWRAFPDADLIREDNTGYILLQDLTKIRLVEPAVPEPQWTQQIASSPIWS